MGSTQILKSGITIIVSLFLCILIIFIRTNETATTTNNSNSIPKFAFAVQQLPYAIRQLTESPNYPIIVSVPLKNSNATDLFGGYIEILDVKDGRANLLIYDNLEYMTLMFLTSGLKIEEELTEKLHPSHEPYHSSYLNGNQDERNPIYSVMKASMGCYRSVEGYYQTMDFLASEYPTFVDVLDIGPSHLKSIGRGGHEMKAMKITNEEATNVTKYPLFIICGIHPREIAPVEICARFAEDIVTQYGIDADKTWMMNYTEIHMIMLANPDGREDEDRLFVESRRKNMNKDSCFCRGRRGGVDLNRNFPHPSRGKLDDNPGIFGRCKQAYSGEYALSEKETQAIVNYFSSVFSPPPDGNNNNVWDDTGALTLDAKGIFLDFHSYLQAVLWPNSEKSTNILDFIILAGNIASHTVPRYASNNDLYLTTGTSADFAYEVLNMPAISLEVGTEFYEDCDYFETVTWTNGMNIIYYSGRVAKAPFRLSKGPDVIEISVVEKFLSEEVLIVHAIVSDEARISFPKFPESITNVTLYLDSHPYDSDSIPTSVVDTSNFERSFIEVSFNVSIAGFSPGKHILYLQGHDTQEPGPVYAEFFEFDGGIEIDVNILSNGTDDLKE